MWEGLGGPVRMEHSDLGEIDPTLDSCCRREIESNRKRSVLEETLSRHDVVAMKERRKRHLLPNLSWGVGCRCCYDPNSDGGEYRALMEARDLLQQETEQQQEEEESQDQKEESEDDSDDEFDFLLDEELPGDNGGAIHEMEEQRRAELEFALLQQEVAIQHGYGVHRQMHPNRVLKGAGLGGTTPSPAVVLHLVDPDSMASATLDLCLEDLAKTHRGTKFLRSGGRSVLLMEPEMCKKSMPRLSPDADMPALVAIREGVVIAVCPRLQGLVSEDDSDDAVVLPEEVSSWLDKAGVLLDRPPPMEEVCLIRPEEEALMDHLAASTKNAPPRYDCGMPMCDKTFPHEHVGVQTKQQDGLVVQEEDVIGNKEE